MCLKVILALCLQLVGTFVNISGHAVLEDEMEVTIDDGRTLNQSAEQFLPLDSQFNVSWCWRCCLFSVGDVLAVVAIVLLLIYSLPMGVW